MTAAGNAPAPPPPPPPPPPHVHVAMLATPGMGHLIPLAELAKRLSTHRGVTSTLITFASTASATQRAFLATLPSSSITSVSLPAVDLSDLPLTAAIEMRMSEECSRSLPALTTLLTSLTSPTRRRTVVFVADQFGTAAFDAAIDAGVKTRCLFMPMNLHVVSFLLRLPDLAASIFPGEFRDLAEPVRMPGCVPIPGIDIPSPLQERSNPSFAVMVNLARRYRDADAILVNSFHAVEPGAAAALRLPEHGRPPVFPIGPLIRQSSSDDGGTSTTVPPPRSPCLEWLDRQTARSVIFVSFGSGGALPESEMHELALGLERSGQRFLWVVRSPPASSITDNYYDAESKADPFVYLPEGFLERTAQIGLVVSSWAPQTEVLAHEATGAFLTHCGWNSTLESLVHGVPMVAWPLFAEQRMNAVMLAEQGGVGAAVRLIEEGRKERESIAAAVREVMVGDGIGALVREKVVEIKKKAAEGLSDGGAATMALEQVVAMWEADEGNLLVAAMGKALAT